MKNNINGASFSSLFSAADIICQTSFTESKDVIKEVLEKVGWNRDIGSTSEAYNAVM